MSAIGVQFDKSLVRLSSGSFATETAGMLRLDFYDWLKANIGEGFLYPVRGWNAEQDIRWIWYDDRLTRDAGGARKWERDGICIMFLDHRQATYAKLTWGGRQ